MKVSELTGPALDYWVAKAENASDNVGSGAYVAFARMEKWGETWEEQQAHPNHRFAPSSDWEHGGPIIDRDKIRLQPPRHAPQWTADCVGEGGAVHFADGPTPLIAAMRAKVASEYGEEVPDLMGERAVVA